MCKKKCSMTQEEKDILLKDLCARLPYGVKCYNEFSEKICELAAIEADREGVLLCFWDKRKMFYHQKTYIREVRPYLLPLSSMTEKQKEEYHYIVNYISPDDTENWAEGEFVYVNQIEQLLHFYHTNHLDYRGLIPEGLAINATGLNIY